MEEHKGLYKNLRSKGVDLKGKLREDQNELWKQNRFKMFCGKRARLRLYENVNDEMTAEQIRDIARKLKDKKEDRHKLLKLLVIGFSQGVDNIQAYIECDQSLTCLVGLLLGSDAELVLWSVWCLTNAAAGTKRQASFVIKHAGPYLVTMLSVRNATLQDQCAWALGNLASAGDACRKNLLSMGVLRPLASLLKSTSRNVVGSSAFALSNVLRSDLVQKDPETVQEIVRDMTRMLEDASKGREGGGDGEGDDHVISECLWTLSFLSFGHLGVALDDPVRLIKALVGLLKGRTESSDLDLQLLTPLIRILGNLVCELPAVDFHVAIAGAETFSALDAILRSGIPHLQKETLWLLSNMTAHCQLASELANHEISETIEVLVQPERSEATTCEGMDFQSASIT